MPNTIILPIKCSTLKRLDDYLWIVFMAEGALIWYYLGCRYIFGGSMLWFTDPKWFPLWTLIALGFLTGVVIALFGLLSIYVYWLVAQFFPLFECIKDEDDL